MHVPHEEWAEQCQVYDPHRMAVCVEGCADEDSLSLRPGECVFLVCQDGSGELVYGGSGYSSCARHGEAAPNWAIRECV